MTLKEFVVIIKKQTKKKSYLEALECLLEASVVKKKDEKNNGNKEKEKFFFFTTENKNNNDECNKENKKKDKIFFFTPEMVSSWVKGANKGYATYLKNVLKENDFNETYFINYLSFYTETEEEFEAFKKQFVCVSETIVKHTEVDKNIFLQSVLYQFMKIFDIRKSSKTTPNNNEIVVNGDLELKPPIRSILSHGEFASIEPPMLINRPNLCAFEVFGRDNECQIIDNLFDEGSFIFIVGLGGIGKSAIAAYYAQTRGNGHNKRFNTIQMIKYDTNLINTIAKLEFHNFDENIYGKGGDANEFLFKKKMKLLSAYNENTLIVIDNFNTESDPNLIELLSMNCKFLFTTRCGFEKFIDKNRLIRLIHINNIDEVLKLFYKNYTKRRNHNEETERCIKNIIKLVDYHTLTVELLAKTLDNSTMLPQDMLKKLEEDFLSNLNIPVSFLKDGQESEDNSIYAHLLSILDITNLFNEENKIKYEIMKNMSLMPSNVGVEKVQFCNWIGLENMVDINKLIRSGWLKNDDEDNILLHSLVSNIMYHQLKPNSENCQKLIKAIIEYFNEQKDKPYSEHNLVAEYVKSICKRIEPFAEESNLTADLYFSCGMTNWLLAQYDLALQYHKKALDIRKIILSDNNIDTAKSYHSVGEIYERFFENYSVALEHLEKAKASYKSINYEKTLDISLTYNEIGRTYTKLGKYEEAENNLNKAFEICKLIGDNKDILIITYRNLGNLYGSVCEFQKALNCYKETLNLCNNIYGNSNHLYIALANHGIGYSYHKLGNYETALRFLSKAKEIFDKILVSDNLYSAVTYNTIGLVKANMEKYDDALEYCNNALQMRLNIFGEGHSTVAASYNNIGAIYRKIGNVLKATEYNSKALSICPNIYESAKNLSTPFSYDELGKYFFYNIRLFYDL